MQVQHALEVIENLQEGRSVGLEIGGPLKDLAQIISELVFILFLECFVLRNLSQVVRGRHVAYSMD